MSDIDNILEQGLNGLMPYINTRLPGITARMLKTESIQRTFSSKNALYNDVMEFMKQRGELIACYDQSKMLAAMIRGGFLNLNPALVICCIDKNQIWIAVHAKEGLIKQRTAEKVLKRFQTEFEAVFV